MSIFFEVAGIPQPQGSKTSYAGKNGGRPRMVDANAKTKPWRAAVAAAASEAMDGRPLLAGPVQLQVGFKFPRLKSHFRSGKNRGLLKNNAPSEHATRPDLDKLLRAIGDSLTGVVLFDDSQISEILASKSYADAGSVWIEITEFADIRLGEPHDER